MFNLFKKTYQVTFDSVVTVNNRRVIQVMFLTWRLDEVITKSLNISEDISKAEWQKVIVKDIKRI